MPIWSRLYGMVWLGLLEIMLILPPIYPTLPVFVHILVGAAIVALAFSNYVGLKAANPPPRLVRIARTTRNLSIGAGVIGVLIYPTDILSLLSPLRGFLVLVHLVISIAIITQASSVATGYDMWEEREFEQVPAPPPTAKSAEPATA